MSLIAVGLNHTTAPVELRERIAITGERVETALRSLASRPGVDEAAILSTCNRTELYCGVANPGGLEPVSWLHDYHRLDSGALEPFLYTHQQEHAVRHMLRVATGLDSMVLGEPQILGQVKAAYHAARRAETLRAVLERLFQHTFATAKRIRTDTAIGANAVSVAYAAVRLAHQIFGELGQETVLLVGGGDTVELTARHLRAHGANRLVFANRTVERANELAARFSGYAVRLKDLHQHLAEADIVISSTASQAPLIGPQAMKAAIRARKHRPVFMVDLAVPRDIDPAVAKLDDVYLYTVDDLQSVIDESLRRRRDAAGDAEEVVELQVEQFMGWLQSLGAVDTIKRFRGKAQRHREAVLAKARARLASGQDPEAVMELLANNLTNRLLHDPTRGLREAASEGRWEAVDILRALHNLDNEPTGEASADDDETDS